ncbi:cuticle protein 16.8-like [Stegodyphus dumicola]|uniref:cuticle protein 16.8-like n=1 Tax=Stegodyphus dumicola TaxID=202533 RepID=UPI0015B19C6D|nr:cuticle protein 16.8-like [Stegodyphus dumicola]
MGFWVFLIASFSYFIAITKVSTLPIAEPLQREEVLKQNPLIDFPTPYVFGYDIQDGKGTSQHRHEISDLNGFVEGTYGYSDPLGVHRNVRYTADLNGYRAVIRSNEPGISDQNTGDAVYLVQPPPPAAIFQGAKVIVPFQNV